MSTIAGYVAPQLPENKLRLYPTKVINIIGGPGCDKSLYSSAIVLKLHLRHKSVETVPDVAKSLVWQRDLDALRNQYGIALQQFRAIEVLDGQVQFLVTEGALPQLLYYNASYPDNVCDVEKTRQQILAWYKQFNNVNVLVQRDPDKKYVRSGRFQDEAQAQAVDHGIRGVLHREGIPYTVLPPDHRAIIEFAATLE
ncbi:hypothetical protein [Aquabacterium sp. A08]|uniref:hypothetical protein n=1 Tax=Aquabacterium sp. A08 TaxID=2718532 RepID=UPI00141E20BA|nr:hypothetical protein [Aquabacterium sp. A08]NIC41634.1 hypothetical protein [Aquabacterium sp. A08]NIC41661.1 hypothetical protein [Aquabacterium sp. A08]